MRGEQPDGSSLMLGIVIVAAGCSVFWFVIGVLVGHYFG